MLDIFIFGSFWFWALIVAEFVLLLVFTEWENGVAATISAIVFLAALQFMGNVDILGHIYERPYSVIFIVLAYLLIGIGWATFQWVRFNKAKIRKYYEILAEYCERYNLPRDTKVLPEEHKKEWIRQVSRSEDKNKETIASTPKIRHHKAKVMKWMSLWVFSMILFFLKDMVKEFVYFIYLSIAGHLQKIADSIWNKSDIADNLKVSEVMKDDENEDSRSYRRN